MADIKNKNELKRRIDLFLDDFTHEEYMINEPFCKETMQMMREFVGRASHLLDCADAKIKKAKRKERENAIEEFAEEVKKRAYSTERIDWAEDYMISIWKSVIDEIARELKEE